MCFRRGWLLLVAGALAAGACAAVSSTTWSRVSLDEAVFGGESDQSMFSVTAGGPGLVAVGRDGSGGDSDAAVWISPDGVTWSRVPHDEAVFGGAGFQQILAVTVGGPGLVAVGRDGSGGDPDGAVWTSPDGVTWSRVPHDEAVFGGENEQVMRSVTAGGPGLVAVGWDGPRDEFFDGAVWTSPDGVTWSRVPHDEEVFGGEGFREMRSVTAGGLGLVAVGREFGGGDSDGAVWTSPDGVTWSRVPDDEGVLGGDGSQLMLGVTAGGPGLVAVGNDRSGGDSDGAVWTSPDGVTWSRAPHNEADLGGSGSQEMSSVTAGGPGLVAIGQNGPLNTDAAVWTSPDGVTWSRVPDDGAVLGGDGSQQMFGVTAGGPGLVAVGRDDSAGDSDGAVWVATTGD